MSDDEVREQLIQTGLWNADDPREPWKYFTYALELIPEEWDFVSSAADADPEVPGSIRLTALNTHEQRQFAIVAQNDAMAICLAALRIVTEKS